MEPARAQKRKRQGVTGVTHQLVLPRQLRDIVLESLHNDMGHLGIERTLDLVRARFYWPKMQLKERLRHVIAV